MSRPIIGFLAEFSEVDQPVDVPPDEAPPATDPAVDEADRLRALVQAAREEGLAEGRRLGDDAAEVRLQQLAGDHAAALEAARAAWAAGEGESLASTLISGLAALEAALADNLAGVVTPFLAPAARHRAALELRAALAALMAGTHGGLIEIRGPGDILEPLRVALADNAAVVLTEADGVDVVVEAGDTTIRSQLQAWSERFEKALQPA
jgi:hypothetical protein